MTYNIFTIGCQMNKADSERLAFYLESLGFVNEVDFLQADLVIFVTCGVRQSAEDRIYGLVNRISKKSNKAIMFLTGCLSYREDVKSRLGSKVKLYFNINDLLDLDKSLIKYFPKIKKFSDLNKKRLKNYLEINTKNFSQFSAFVPIGNGCDNFCSYCVVPYARGREVYRPFKEIICEVEGLVKRGYKEINFIAQNVNSYKSGRYDFADLLRAIDNISGNFWIRFSTSHPKDVSPKLIKVLRDSKKVCEHFHLAVQSGDNDILRAMNRKYTVEKFEKTLKMIRLALDNKNGFPASITTDIIVGFPGETKAKFNNTKKLFKSAEFDLAYISRYSPRYGTVSAEMLDNVSLEEKKRREMELENVLKKIAKKINAKYLNREVEVLLEGISRKGEFFGKTRTAKIVKIKKSDDKFKIGDFVKVKIIAIKEFELWGEKLLTTSVEERAEKLIKEFLIDKQNKNYLSKNKILNSEKKEKNINPIIEKNKENKKVVVILGPTSSGKTALAVKMAYKFKGEIVSADSRQVYRGMDIGTGKDLAEYNFKGQKIPYHLLDVVSPKNVFTLAKYQKIAFLALEDILKRQKTPFFVGGSGLYLEAIINNYILNEAKPVFGEREKYENMSLKVLHNKIKKINSKFFENLNNSELNNKRRLARYLEILMTESNFSPRKGESLYNFLIIGLNPERDLIREKIHKRLIQRLEEEDMIGEIQRLRKEGVSYKRLESFGLEYRYVAYYLQKKITYQQLVDKLFIAICQFAKRQMSWFRRMEKGGTVINWIKN